MSAELRRTAFDSMGAFFRLLGEAAPGARTLELGSVIAAVNPAVPERSLFNSVLYEQPDDLLTALDQLQSTYEQAGVEGWTVWVPAEHVDVIDRLEHRGHVLDSDPDALGFELSELDAGGPGELDLVPDAGLEEILALNDAAYPWPDGTFSRAVGALPEGGWHFHCARLDGRPASGLMTYDHLGNCRVEFVATTPEARGKGLASQLLRRALTDARDRGCATTTLHSTKMGQPVYERVGYRVIGSWQMWERRQG